MSTHILTKNIFLGHSGFPPVKLSLFFYLFIYLFISSTGDEIRTQGCSHERAAVLFLESLYPNLGCEFVSYPCSSWEDYQGGLCSDCESSGGCPLMGYYADRSGAEGLLYLETGSVSPYCILDED